MSYFSRAVGISKVRYFMTLDEDKIAMEIYKRLNEQNFYEFSYRFFTKQKKKFIECTWLDDQGFRTTHSETWED